MIVLDTNVISEIFRSQQVDGLLGQGGRVLRFTRAWLEAGARVPVDSRWRLRTVRGTL